MWLWLWSEIKSKQGRIKGENIRVRIVLLITERDKRIKRIHECNWVQKLVRVFET